MYHTTEDLRKSIMQDLQDLREGRINNATARARAQVVRTVLDTVHVEIAAAQLGKGFGPITLSNEPGKLKVAK